MVQAKLDLHRGGNEVDRDFLATIEAVPETETWRPTRHIDVLDRVLSTLDGAGYGVEQMQLSVARDNHRFFGTLLLKTRVTQECSLAVGIRNSTDKSFPIGFCVGERVFVCSNLAFHSELIVNRRHTKFGASRYEEAISRATLSLPSYQAAAQQRIARLQQWELSSTQADSLILQAYEKEVVSSRLLPDVIREWRNPRHPEFRPRNAFSLLNCFTEIFKERQKSNPQEAALQTIQLQRLLNPPPEVIDVDSTAIAD